MLWLKVVRHEGEYIKDALTGKILTYSMRYYYDDENGKCYDCIEYYNLRKQKREDKFNNLPIYLTAKKLWDDANTERIDARSAAEDVVLDKPIAGKDNN